MRILTKIGSKANEESKVIARFSYAVAWGKTKAGFSSAKKQPLSG
jgi:hypothetical protein